MTAGELIDYLHTVPSDTIVSVHGYEGGIQDTRSSRFLRVALNVNTEWYYGPHELYDDQHPTESAFRVLIG